MGAWVRGWRDSNLGIGREGRVGPKIFLVLIKKTGRVRNFGVGETYDFN